MIVDALCLWLTIRIYKNAFRGKKNTRMQMWTMCLLLIQLKQKYCSVTRHFNDCFMALFVQLSILGYQNGWLWLSTFLFAIAINIKMGAMLMFPGYMLAVAFDHGIARALLTLILMIALQFGFGIEFILVNADAYFSMSYNFARKFTYYEQVGFRYVNRDLYGS